MSDFAGDIIGIAIFVVAAFAIPAFLIWVVGSRVGGRKSRRTEEEFEKEYEEKHEAAMHCRKCGYDLRATPDRCPECGTAHVDRREYLRRLQEDWPANPIDPRLPGPEELPELLMSTETRDEADLLHKQLIARGVACYGRKSKIAGQYYRRVFYEIMVYTADLETARAFFNHAQAPSRSEAFAEK